MQARACARRHTSDALVQDEEDAKRGLYNHFADSKLLLTMPRMLLGTIIAVTAPAYLLSSQQALSVLLVVGKWYPWPHLLSCCPACSHFLCSLL